MKILATADLHGNLPEIEPCDLLIIAGDILPDGPIQDRWARNHLASWLAQIPAKHIIAIAGNHDFAFEKHPWLPRESIFRWTYLKDEMAEIEGLRVYGAPWVPRLASWAFYKPSEGLLEAFAKIPTDLDILISHGPPLGFCDSVGGMVYRDGHFMSGAEHVGSQELLEAIQEKKPAKNIFGHIHEGFGLAQNEHTEFWNVAYVDEIYRPRKIIPEIL